VVEIAAVGICGSDVHLYAGHVNWHVDASGRTIPLSESPQILGHEIVGVVREIGSAVQDLAVGDRVVVDQGINCSSRGRDRADWCGYCRTGYCHHCDDYVEHGITGLPGGFADRLLIPAVNAVRIDGDLSFEIAAMTEPLGCVLHSLRLMESLGGRHAFGEEDPDRRVRSVVLAGLGPSGQLFGQAVRTLLGFEGTILASDPDPSKREAAARDFGAETIDPTVPGAMVDAVRSRTGGRGAEVLIDACGAPAAWADFASMLRKQGTAILYGFGRERGTAGSLDSLQWRGAHLIASSGASGSIDADGRPALYREALEHLSAGRIRVDHLVTHRYSMLEDLDRALGHDPSDAGYLKGVLIRG
jgi:L-iditol 2-dehydrogenase